MVEHVGIAEASRIVGVTRARVYQRVNGVTGAGEDAPRAERIPSTQEAQLSPLTGRSRSVTVVPLSAVLRWRADRIAAGLPVGTVPDGYGAPPVVIAIEPSDEPVGLPSMRAY